MAENKINEEINKEEGYRNKKFIIAEILACIAFILNTICVLTAKEIHGPGAPAWLPHFGIVYWFKTTLAIIGLFYFFTSGVFITKKMPRYISISTLIILWYSIPVVNFFFNIIFNMLFSGISIARKEGITFQSRIPTQIIWSIPVFIVAIYLLVKSLKIKK